MNAATQILEYVDNCLEDIQEMYSTPVFRGTLKARDGDCRFGRLKLDAETAFRLGSDNVGLFVESCPSFERMVENFRQLKDNPFSKWVVVASSKQVAAKLKQSWQTHGANNISDNELDRSTNVVISTPEELKQIDLTIHDNIAGILIFDYACHIHKCRGFSNRRFYVPNDRPQKIVDFRSRLRVGEWSTPMFIFTNRPAISVNTQPMLSPYCLEAFRYIDGQTMRFGEI